MGREWYLCGIITGLFDANNKRKSNAYHLFRQLIPVSKKPVSKVLSTRFLSSTICLSIDLPELAYTELKVSIYTMRVEIEEADKACRLKSASRQACCHYIQGKSRSMVWKYSSPVERSFCTIVMWIVPDSGIQSGLGMTNSLVYEITGVSWPV